MIDVSLLSSDIVELAMEIDDSLSDEELIGCEVIDAASSEYVYLRRKHRYFRNTLY